MSKKEGLALFLIGVDSGKEAILYATGIEKAGPRFMHFPIDYRCGYDEEYFRGLISEKKVIHRSKGQNTIAWEKVHERNEPLDCRNYARAAFKYFNWDFNAVERRLNGVADQPTAAGKKKAEQKKYVVSSGIKV